MTSPPSPRRPTQRGSTSPIRLTSRGKTLLGALLASAVVIVFAIVSTRGHHRTSADPPASTQLGQRQTTPSTTPATPTSRTARTATSVTSPTPTIPVPPAIRSIIDAAPAGGVSVAARNVTTGASFSAGAPDGMTCASVAKVQILESLLLQHGGPLSGSLNDLAEDMIENSSNAAADTLYTDLGGPSAFADFLQRLGLNPKLTVPDEPLLWGLTTTSAGQYLILLNHLVDATSPLTPAARTYALNLMQHVADDQRWGVPEVADDGTDPANKNGWLSVGTDDDLWAVNSVGVVSVHGDRVAIAVFTQHSPDMATGQELVSRLVAAAAAAVAP